MPCSREAPERRCPLDVPVDDRTLPFYHVDSPRARIGTGLGQGETYPKATDQKARPVGLLQHVECGTDHQSFGAAIR